MTYTDAQVRTAIETVIQTAAPLAVVYPWWVLGAKQDIWPGLVRSASDGNRAHGYVFTRSRDEGIEKAMRCVDHLWTYDLMGFHYYSTGTKAANTDLTFNAELDAIAAAFDDVASLPAALKRRQPLQWNVDLNVYGGELLHFAVGSLTIEAC
jgi:hypothetical protein